MPRITLFKKILTVTLLLSMLPMLVISLILLSSLESVSQRLTTEIAGSSDIQASQNLQMRAQHVAETIADFLRQRESDLIFLSQTSLDRNTLQNFYTTRRGELWERRGTLQSPAEVHELVPLYRSIAVIDSNGLETTVIRNGKFLPKSELRNVSRPESTEYLSEDYFKRIQKLKKGEIHVTHLTGFHISKQEQLAGASEPELAINGRFYEGVIRFGTPLFDSNGKFKGAVVISLDHRHLMEFTQHIDPGVNFSTIFPSYKSGNYAFLFDDEGWIITHPKFWDLRGVDKNGKPVPAYSKNSSKEDIESGRIPFNLDQAGFIHPNYPVVAKEVRLHKKGYVDTTNVGGAKKIMAYAPILYDTGDYSRFGIFGGVTIGFHVDQFHGAARKGSRLINSELKDHRTRSIFIILATTLLAGVSAWMLSRGITSPINKLTAGARRLAQGDASLPVQVSSSDELGELADTFNLMSNELELRKTSLLNTLDELQRSRMEILEERNFKESILESISSAIVTFSSEGLLTSINATGKAFLGDIGEGMHFSEVFAEWAEMPQKIEETLTKRTGYGRQALHLDRGNGMTYFEIGLFQIKSETEKGLTVTIRNETEKEKLREEMTRLERLASLGKLSAGIAHEVRNPLTGISLLLDDLHDRASLAADDQEMLKKALSEIERVDRLISALLSYSAPARLESTISDLNQVVRDVVLLLSKQCERQNVSTFMDVEDVPLLLGFDQEKIKQALLNVMKNALEALPSGGLIKISTSSDTCFASILISDNGPGIPEEDLPLIFEPFFTRKGAGTGLGLSITQRIMDEHQGKIVVQSNAGNKGTTFILELPLTK